MAKPAFTVKKLECDAFDNRVVERHIARGRVSRAEAAKHLANLPDEADNAEEITVSLDDSAEEQE